MLCWASHQVRMRMLKGDTFVFWPRGRCQIWRPLDFAQNCTRPKSQPLGTWDLGVQKVALVGSSRRFDIMQLIVGVLPMAAIFFAFSPNEHFLTSPRGLDFPFRSFPVFPQDVTMASMPGERNRSQMDVKSGRGTATFQAFGHMKIEPRTWGTIRYH